MGGLLLMELVLWFEADWWNVCDWEVSMVVWSVRLVDVDIVDTYVGIRRRVDVDAVVVAIVVDGEASP